LAGQRGGVDALEISGMAISMPQRKCRYENSRNCATL
jgi:hypothetical protein